MINSGSFFLILICLLAWGMIRLFLIRLSLRYYTKPALRRIGFKLSRAKASVFKAIIKLVVESFLDLVLASFMNLANIISVGSISIARADFINTVLMFATVLFVLVIPPVAYLSIKGSFPLPKKAKQTLKFKLVNVLIPDLRRNELSALMANVHFLNRRILTVVILMWVNHSYFQNVLFIWLSLVQLCYLFTIRPFIDRNNNRVEIISEVCVYICCYLMLLFCNEGILDSAQSLMGWIYIGIVSFSVAVNLGVSTFDSFKDLT